jgi:hypothetical protein
MTTGNKSILSMLASSVLLSLMACDPCSHTIKSEAVSVDRKLVARVSERNCGATTEFSSVVNVQRASDKFDPDAGVYFVAKGRYDVSAKWTGDRELLVTCSRCTRKDIFHEVAMDGDITISYSTN